jgi:hypothetical protein
VREIFFQYFFSFFCKTHIIGGMIMILGRENAWRKTFPMWQPRSTTTNMLHVAESNVDFRKMLHSYSEPRTSRFNALRVISWDGIATTRMPI